MQWDVSERASTEKLRARPRRIGCVRGSLVTATSEAALYASCVVDIARRMMWPLLCIVDEPETCSSSIKTLIVNKQIKLTKRLDNVCAR